MFFVSVLALGMDNSYRDGFPNGHHLNAASECKFDFLIVFNYQSASLEFRTP